ncbi:MAG: DUF2628 domain-containing protein [Alphaproteobacteria bacterium]|nr:DUF2628 domain-containing protein [Alphaproteobacteria bacterium]
MRTYTVHQTPSWAIAGEPDSCESIVLIADGFNWFSFLLTIPWALWHRMWWIAAGLFLLVGCIGGASQLLRIDQFLLDLIGVSLLVWIGFESNDWRRQWLAHRGWRDLGLVVARNRGEAEARFFDRWVAANPDS